MVILEIITEAQPNKRRELEMAVQSMTRDIRKYAGCHRVEACQHLANTNTITITAEWITREALDRYIASDDFSALLGTRIILACDLSITLYAVAAREGAETILAVRT